MKSSITLSHKITELSNLENHILQLKSTWDIPRKDAIEINLVLDELVTNIIEHQDIDEEGLITINFTLKGKQLTIEVIDRGPPFDPTSCKAPDTTLPLEERKCGGLGVLLVKKFSNYCSYTRLKKRNIFSVKKTIKQESR